jgi:hypothetical protein
MEKGIKSVEPVLGGACGILTDEGEFCWYIANSDPQKDKIIRMSHFGRFKQLAAAYPYSYLLDEEGELFSISNPIGNTGWENDNPWEIKLPSLVKQIRTSQAGRAGAPIYVQLFSGDTIYMEIDSYKT